MHQLNTVANRNIGTGYCSALIHYVTSVHILLSVHEIVRDSPFQKYRMLFWGSCHVKAVHQILILGVSL